MKNKAVFLDRDGTLIIDKGYAYEPKKIEFMPDVISSLKRLENAGFLLIIITNQSGIARGFFTEKQLRAFNTELLERLRLAGVNITDLYYCPHHPEGVIEKYTKVCSCRKPGVELFLRAAEEHNIDFSASYAIGDSLRDCAISSVSACTGCLIGKMTPEAENNVQQFSDLGECVDFILKG